MTIPTGAYSPYFIGNDLTIGSFAVPGPVMANETSKSVEGCSEGSKKSNVGIIVGVYRVQSIGVGVGCTKISECGAPNLTLVTT